MTKTTIYIPADLHRRLRDEARHRNASQADLVREALVRFLDERPRRLPRSIGIVSDGSLSAADVEDWIDRTWIDHVD